MSARKRLGEVLRERNQISQADLDHAIEAQQSKYVHLGELMLERGFVAKRDLIEALGEVSRTPYIDCETVEIDPQLLSKVPHEVATRCAVLPVETQGTRLIVAMAEPQNLAILDELRFSTGMEIVPRFAFRREVLAAIDKRYGALAKSGAAPLKGCARPYGHGRGIHLLQLTAAEQGGHGGDPSRAAAQVENHSGGSRGGLHDHRRCAQASERYSHRAAGQ